MTTAITNPSSPENILADNKNWWPKYPRDVYKWNEDTIYIEGDFVYVHEDEWLDFADDHADAD